MKSPLSGRVKIIEGARAGEWVPAPLLDDLENWDRLEICFEVARGNSDKIKNWYKRNFPEVYKTYEIYQLFGYTKESF